MPRLKLLVAYDGRPFCGWQSQADGQAVQDFLQAAFAEICGKKIVVHGAGRTDAGVHALGQCAHADVPERAFDWRRALNANLPPEIRVQRCAPVHDDFHARFSAKGKIYLYRLWNNAVLSPFELGRAAHIPSPLDQTILEKTSRLFLGRHDFAAFAANRGHPPLSTVRTIHALRVRSRGPLITLTFLGDGFLYKMVRLMTGALLRVAQGRSEPVWINRLLAGQHGKSSFAAPAEGLYLKRVLY